MSTELEQQLRAAMERFTDDVRVPPLLLVPVGLDRETRRWP
jgi:hypothetical protein